MTLNKKFNFEKQIGQLPKKVIWCRKCLMSNQRPRIIFNNDNVCSGCINSNYKNTINWKKREKELINLLDKYRSKNGNYDVLVPSSGGKDSGYVAHQLKYKYNMNPLTVTWSPLSYTEIGRNNFYSLINSGFSNILCTPNGALQRKFARLAFEELGDPFHVFVLGQLSFPFHMAIKFGIKLVFYGENGELEYAGDAEVGDKPVKPPKFWTKHHFKGSSFEKLLRYGVSSKDYLKGYRFKKSDLEFYVPPAERNILKAGIKGIHFYSYYKKWTPQENYYYCVENTGFKPNIERSEGTYSKYASLDDKIDCIHYYMRYIKFGLGRCSEDASHEIRDGHLTREEGLSLMSKYEGEFPKKYFKEFLEYLDITEQNFFKIVDSWRLPHIWKKDNNKWVLRNPAF